MQNRKMRRGVIFSGILAVLLMAAASAAAISLKRQQKFHAEFLNLFDTVTQIVGYAPDQEKFAGIAGDIHDELETYHKLYDSYHDYDGIANIKTVNDHAGEAPVKVDQKIIDLLKLSKAACERTGGKVNVAMGSVLSIWHEYRRRGIDDPERAALPPMEELLEAARHTDLSKVIIDEAASTVYLADPDMRLDVGAVAKGYATERTAKSLEAKGLDHILLNVGGNVRAIGRRADRKLWKVEIQDPDKGTYEGTLDTLELEEMSLVSSGDYQRYYTVEGVRYHHIIDPNTLMPSTYFRAVSILCEDSGWGDALSTAVYNMPYGEGLALIEGMEGVEAMWVLPDRSVRTSSGYEAYRCRGV